MHQVNSCRRCFLSARNDPAAAGQALLTRASESEAVAQTDMEQIEHTDARLAAEPTHIMQEEPTLSVPAASSSMGSVVAQSLTNLDVAS